MKWNKFLMDGKGKFWFLFKKGAGHNFTAHQIVDS